MSTYLLNRGDLERIFPGNYRAVAVLEALQRNVTETQGAIAANVEATNNLGDATVLTLSSSGYFSNERVLALAPGLVGTDGGAGQSFTLALDMKRLAATNGGFRCTFNLRADTNLDVPTMGRLVESTLGGAAYADDAAAAAAGVRIGEIYRKTGGTVAWRQA